ncbi:anti-repressor SinI family protein [Paenibacillus sp. UNC451MF]|uniref:anti-repressor SinI family protein n=1 Tax=Paenibacillus sp. UNC451MF TaxID=1449063 RepID=UPI000AA6AD01|nr:anti-repressor SinI family protein [Paenibacillus sp. UNC451MF]
MTLSSTLHTKSQDMNWFHLMIAARDSGLSTEEVRQFFNECKKTNIKMKNARNQEEE